jgi:hypothetical protein
MHDGHVSWKLDERAGGQHRPSSSELPRTPTNPLLSEKMVSAARHSREYRVSMSRHSSDGEMCSGGSTNLRLSMDER